MNYVHFSGELRANPAFLSREEVSFTLATPYVSEGKKLEIKELGVEFFAHGHLAESIARRCLKGDQLIVTAKIEACEVGGFRFILQDFQLGVLNAPGISDSGKVVLEEEAS